MENYYTEQGLLKPHLPKVPPQRVLEGQTALVTGAGSGIGQAVAIALAEAGANVVINYVTHPEQADETLAAVKAKGAKGLTVQADVSNETQVQAMFQKAVAEFGRFDILVNNAGLQMDAAFHEMTLAQWQTVIGVNLTGQFLCAREAVRLFMKQGVDPAISCAAGKILCISSVHEVIPWAGHVNYASSKGGILMMMKSLSQEVAQHRIRVNSIGPGAIKTPINTAAWQTEEAYNKLMKLVPYKRIGEAEEIGRAAVWLCSDYSDYVNGTTLFVDGGMTLYPGFETGG
jgi:glucose 1-dehydrogenase